YLTHKAEKLGYHAQIINSGRFVNDSMGGYVGKQTVKKIIAAGKNIQEAKVLVMGATFKENVSDIRNSKVVDTVREIQSFGVQVDVVDPHASAEEIKHEYGYTLLEKPEPKYDAIIVAVNHEEYSNLTQEFFDSMLTQK